VAIISDGTTIADAASFSVGLGNMVLLNTATASSSASLSFNSTYINSTYPIYKFEFINMHPASGDIDFQFNMSADNGSNYNVTKTTTLFRAYHREDGGGNSLNYVSGSDLAQSTAFQTLAVTVDNDADSSCVGSLTLFNPSSTTFVKHFISKMQEVAYQTTTQEFYIAGYGNTTSAVDAIQFKMASGNIDAGQIKLYGIKGS
jgi:hypothetical protein